MTDTATNTAPQADSTGYVGTPPAYTSQQTTIATDPVDATTAQHGGLDPNLQGQLQAFLQEAQANKQQQGLGLESKDPYADTDKATDNPLAERPSGGLNDISPDDIGDPNAARFVRLLDAHYPNIDRERVLGRALEFGDPDLIDINYLKDVVGDQYDLVLPFFEDIVEQQSQGFDAVVNEIHEFVGGKAQWEGIANAFATNAPASVRNVVKQLVDSNKLEDVKQGIEFIVDFAQRNGLAAKQPKRLDSYGQSTGGDTLTAEQFRAALRELGGRNSDPKRYDTQVEILRKQRAAGIELGL